MTAANSLVGLAGSDAVGSGGVTALSNGNYVVRSQQWANGALTAAGAMTWGSGMVGARGAVSTTNSLVGDASDAELKPVVVDDVNETLFATFAGEGSGTIRVGSAIDGLSPTLGAVSSSNLNQTGATLSGSVTSANGSTITARGFAYAVTATNSDPRIGGTGVTVVTLSGTTGAMSTTLTGLATGTTYSFRSYATNAAGTSHSKTVVAFTPVAPPSVGSPTSTGITGTASTLGGNVTFDGGSTITERGIVYSLTATNANPLIGGTGVIKSTVTGTTGLFTATVTGLSAASSYSFKAYATNAIGTGYSSVATFTTPTTPPGAPTIGTATAGNGTVSVTFTVPSSNGGSVITGYTATCGTRSASGPSSPITVTGLTNGAAVRCTVVATNAFGNSAASEASLSVYPGLTGEAIPRLVNISTRAKVQTGDDVMIAGFIIGGSAPKRVLITARGLSLAALDVPGTIADPFLQLFSGSKQVDFNDDYQSRPNWSEIPEKIRPPNEKEAAILTTLNPGPYTAIVTGVGGTSGVAIVEAFEMDLPEIPLINISTRSRVETGDNVMIAGFIIHGHAPRTVLVTARGPSLAVAPFNVPNTLADPYLRVHSGQTVLHENDNWATWPTASEIPETLRPKDSRDAAVLVTLPPGAYTVIVGGGIGSTGSGIAIVEVFIQ